ncbi:MAG: hypothetical protein D6730_19875 [Bacteroidetes bacterium]|nr:MAG: hypothetical protein D6730_19875 [Bacteroidota bacterium]
MNYSSKAYFEKIDRYLNQQMGAEELEVFEAQLKSDPGLQEEVHLQQLARQAVQLYQDQVDLREWKEMGKQLLTSQPVSRGAFGMKASLRLVAELAFLLILWWPQQPQSCQNLQLAQKYYSGPDTAPLKNAQGPASPESVIEAARKLFRKGRYEDAIKQLLPLTQQQQPKITEAKYLLAHAYFAAEKYGQAASLFAQVSTAKDLRFSAKASNMQAISYLAGGDLSSLQELVNQWLQSPASPEYQLAKDIEKHLFLLCPESVPSASAIIKSVP